MPRLSANEIRQQFIDYFVKRCGHTFVPSSPCVPLDDPTLMFTNAGMNQFKDVFLAVGTRPYKRAANTQKCIRAGGKHNDLDDVGHDTYHHTFFEMLGNWSFGDYFKKEAIGWAWDLLTNVWGLDKARLHATYFKGDEAEGLQPDLDARDLWLAVPGMDPTHVHPGSKKDNFWEMGDTGPCGPCSEIHIDLTPDKSGMKLVNAGDARVIEIWNLVFIQFNRVASGTLTPLPAKHVDTGMGFERLCAVLQGVNGNYETDVFTPIFEAIRDATKAAPYAGLLESGSKDPAVLADVAYRVIADHTRALVFAITDGAIPDKEGRGYVLRRILRRAVRYGWQYLNMHEPFLYRIVPTVIGVMANAFPELRSRPDEVIGIIRAEEESFGRTMERGLALFDEAADFAIRRHHGEIRGEDAFKLHDTYGFPIDLTQLMAAERGLRVDIGEYERLMEQARERARAAGKSSVLGAEQIPQNLIERLPPTDDSPKYETERLRARVTTILRRSADATFVLLGDRERLQAGEAAAVFCDRTCFYGESGGQVGDSGEIVGPGGRFKVEDSQRPGHWVQHLGAQVEGSLGIGDEVELVVNAARRQTMKNHTVTHMMNWALREVLGDLVQQKGSLVDPDKTRFDLSHNSQISEQQLARVEDFVNKMIEADLPVYAEEVPQDQARRVNTVRAVFGEKYPDVVRAICIGKRLTEMMKKPDNPEWMKYSVEFCGGTHLKHTGEVGRFRLVEESAVAKGVRRVIGITGQRARQAEADATAIFRLLKEAGEAGDEALPNRIAEIIALMSQTELPVVDKARMRDDLAKLQERAKQIQKQAAKAGTADMLTRTDELLQHAERIGGCAVVVGDMGAATIDQLRVVCDSLRARGGSAAVLLAARHEEKVLLLAGMTPDLAARGVKAGDLIKVVSPIVGGKGGGRPDMAQGGGSEVHRIPDAIREAAAWLRAKLGH
ncbi:MAG TPA: alanine--tRNA ligase [Phycisphaerae bacterium]|nr:alanine--tRNA ligase [Phycisphaerae bacterium]